MEVCEECLNREACFKYSWCVTYDKGQKYKGHYVCDNFKPKKQFIIPEEN